MPASIAVWENAGQMCRTAPLLMLTEIVSACNTILEPFQNG